MMKIKSLHSRILRKLLHNKITVSLSNLKFLLKTKISTTILIFMDL